MAKNLIQKKNTSARKTKNVKMLIIHSFFILVSLAFIIPFIYTISVSFSNEKDIADLGYKIIPVHFDLTAYRYVFKNPQKIIDAYTVTASQALLGTVLSTLIMSMCAYPLSRRIFKFRSIIIYFVLFTMFFGAGSVPTPPSYILISKYLKLSNSFMVYIIPSLVGAFNILIFITFFKGLPESLIESAKIDGANELFVYYKIIVPLSKPVIASIAFILLLGRWNDYITSLIYITNPRLLTLQYLLQKILWEADFLKNLTENSPTGIVMDVYNKNDLPLETMTFAMCIIAAGPMLVVFPFFQKYFAKGLTVGAVKG